MKRLGALILGILMFFQICVESYAMQSTNDFALNIESNIENTFDEEILANEEMLEKIEENERGELESYSKEDSLESLEEEKKSDEFLDVQLKNENLQDEVSVCELEVLDKKDPQYGRKNCHTDMYSVERLDDSSYVYDSRFDECEVIDVIDVSEYQGEIEWDKVKQAGIQHAFIRLGYRECGESAALYTDALFEDNIRGAIAAGIEVGIYFFRRLLRLRK